MEESLSSYGVKEGCKLMLIGKRVRPLHVWCLWRASVCVIKYWQTLYKQNSPEEETELKKLKDIEKSVEQTAKKLEKVDGELTGLKNVSNQLCFLRSNISSSVLQYICVETST